MFARIALGCLTLSTLLLAAGCGAVSGDAIEQAQKAAKKAARKAKSGKGKRKGGKHGGKAKKKGKAKGGKAKGKGAKGGRAGKGGNGQVCCIFYYEDDGTRTSDPPTWMSDAASCHAGLASSEGKVVSASQCR